MRLKAFRAKIWSLSRTESFDYECTKCHAKVSGTWRGRCPNCEEWNTLKFIGSDPSPKNQQPQFTQEVEREYIVQYLKHRKISNQPIKFYYKNDTQPREFYQYSFNDTYVYIPSGKGYSYNYLIDRIRNVIA